MILPWLIFAIIGLVTYLFVIEAGFVVLCFGSNVLHGFIFLLITAPFLVLGVYVLDVVQSVYYDLKDGGDKTVAEENADLEKSMKAQNYVKKDNYVRSTCTSSFGDSLN
jgi:hypothetical protein